jgi:AraC family transcriptional regulator
MPIEHSGVKMNPQNLKLEKEIMEPRILTMERKIIIGNHRRMSMRHEGTVDLWRSFMPRRNEILNPSTAELICAQVYDHEFDFRQSTLETRFDKWAGREVVSADHVPSGMEVLEIPSGLYAVFHYVGRPVDCEDFFYNIYFKWLPESGYERDDRPHFEVLGEKYKNDDPSSEEDVYVPIRRVAS